MPSFTVWKKCRARRSVSRRVLSLPRERISMEAFLPMGSRKGMASIYPEVGKFSSNIRIRRISSVSRWRRWIWFPSVQNSSCSTRAVAYSVEQRAAMAARTLSKPIFASSLASIRFYSSLVIREPSSWRSSFISCTVWISPPRTKLTLPVSSETTMISASVSSLRPMAARWRIP